MCGIAGIVDLSGEQIDAGLLRAMNDAIHHRGPDDEGYVLINHESGRHQAYSGDASPGEIKSKIPHIETAGLGLNANIGLSHRRFSIIDLSSAGHQPLFAHDNSSCVVFNGEIYNYVELRSELKALGVRFQSGSDTEVLIEAYRTWGVECFQKFNGFWAIALYDFTKKRLILSRDRLGKKPLYWTCFGKRIYFASEIKSLLCIPEVRRARKVNETAVWHWCVDGRRDLDYQTLFDGIQTLPTACWTYVDEYFPNKINIFWEVPHKRMSEEEISIPEAAKELRETLDDAVRLRLRADVPIAIELSGGMDSSTILALASNHVKDRITTYTIKFPDPRWDEEPFAKSVANRFNTDYRVVEPEFGGFWSQVGAYTWLQEEPYHSPNMQVHTILWSLMRDDGTKVTLTGAAGDELLAGYSRYFFKAQLENLSRGRLKEFISNATYWTERSGKSGLTGLLRELAGMFRLRPLIRTIKSAFPNLDNQYIKNLKTPRQNYASLLTPWLREEITNTQIPYWLRSGEKNYMGIPFEARCPFLDYRVVDLASQLPSSYLVRDGWHKWILRKSMEHILPEDVVWRRVKMGFPYPYERFYEKYRDVIELIITEAKNPYVHLERKERLRKDWNAISFLLWYELFINNNTVLFSRIESMVSQRENKSPAKHMPVFLNHSV